MATYNSSVSQDILDLQFAEVDESDLDYEECSNYESEDISSDDEHEIDIYLESENHVVEEDNIGWRVLSAPDTDGDHMALGNVVTKFSNYFDPDVVDSVVTHYDAFKHFISDEVVGNIVQWTNIRANMYFEERYNKTQQTQQNQPAPIDKHATKGYYAMNGKKWVNVTLDRMWTFISLSIAMSINHLSRLEEYWRISLYNTGPGIFSFYVMSKNEFFNINRFIRFSDPGRATNNPMNRLSQYFDMLRDNCSKILDPGTEISIDEAMVSFKGRLGFRQYLPNKRTRFGIKIFCACLSDNLMRGYTYNWSVYTGNNSYDPNKDLERIHQLSLSERVVVTLMNECGLLHQNRQILLDNWYNSIRLAHYLYKECKTYTLGTVKEARGVPSDLKIIDKLALNQCTFARKDEMLVCKFQGKPNKCVYLLSTKYGAEHFIDTTKRKKGGRPPQNANDVASNQTTASTSNDGASNQTTASTSNDAANDAASNQTTASTSNDGAFTATTTSTTAFTSTTSSATAVTDGAVASTSTASRSSSRPTFSTSGRRLTFYKKPKLIDQYNKRMGGVDICDQMLKCADIARKTRVWFKKMGVHFWSRMALNSMVLYNFKQHKVLNLKRSRDTFTQYLYQLGEQILLKHNKGYVHLDKNIGQPMAKAKDKFVFGKQKRYNQALHKLRQAPNIRKRKRAQCQPHQPGVPGAPVEPPAAQAGVHHEPPAVHAGEIGQLQPGTPHQQPASQPTTSQPASQPSTSQPSTSQPTTSQATAQQQPPDISQTDKYCMRIWNNKLWREHRLEPIPIPPGIRVDNRMHRDCKNCKDKDKVRRKCQNQCAGCDGKKYKLSFCNSTCHHEYHLILLQLLASDTQ